MKFKSVFPAVLAVVCLWAAAQTALLSGVTSTGAGTAVQAIATPSGTKQFQAYAQTTVGTGTAVITVECSLDSTNWNTTVLGTISLTLTTTATAVVNGFTSTDRCKYLRGNVTTINGTGTAATLLMAQ